MPLNKETKPWHKTQMGLTHFDLKFNILEIYTRKFIQCLRSSKDVTWNELDKFRKKNESFGEFSHKLTRDLKQIFKKEQIKSEHSFDTA